MKKKTIFLIHAVNVLKLKIFPNNTSNNNNQKKFEMLNLKVKYNPKRKKRRSFDYLYKNYSYIFNKNTFKGYYFYDRKNIVFKHWYWFSKNKFS